MDHRIMLSLSVVSLFLLSDLSFSAAEVSIGRKAANFNDEAVLKMKTDASLLPPAKKRVDPSKVRRIAWNPRVFLYNGFLTNEECDHLMSLASGRLEKSMVIDPVNGKPYESGGRTCSDTSIATGQDEIVAGIEQRIATWTFLPVDHGEDMQIQRYDVGEKYEPHYDYFTNAENLKIGGNRMATVLMYLTDVEKGGETVFPLSEERQSRKWGDDWSDCARKGLAVKPKRGDALLFFSLYSNTSIDPLSLHTGCPVIKGEKWSATKWIHIRPFDDGSCVDLDHLCHIWLAMDECKKNPIYMIGSETSPGKCRKTCKAC